MVQSLKGRIALVTGASRGIGRGIALELGRRGASVIAVARDEASLSPVCADISELGGQAFACACDLSMTDSIVSLGQLIAKDWGHLDILVSNAAMMGPRTTLDQITEAEWEAVFTTNVTANWLLIRELGHLMLKADTPRAVFLTSGSGSKLSPGRGVYAISKSALDAVVRTWAAEAEATKLRVMLCNPGPARTSMRASIMPDEDPLSLRTPEEIAPQIARMCMPQWQENGKFYDVPRDKILEFRGPA